MFVTSKELLVLAIGSKVIFEGWGSYGHTKLFASMKQIEKFAESLHKELEKRDKALAEKIEIILPSIKNQAEWGEMFFCDSERFGYKAGYFGKLKSDYLSWNEVFSHKLLKKIWREIG